MAHTFCRRNNRTLTSLPFLPLSVTFATTPLKEHPSFATFFIKEIPRKEQGYGTFHN